MYDIIPLVLILLSLAIIIVISVRKFPALANLDVENIPAEKEARFKDQILTSRLKRNLMKWQNRAGKIVTPIGSGLGGFFKWVYGRLIDMKENYKTPEAVLPEDLGKKVIIIFEEVENLRRQDDLATAEKKLIEIISLEPKNIKAFKELAKLYFDRKDLEEARQTYQHILKLREGDEDAYSGLAQIATSSGDLSQAKDEFLASLSYDNQRSFTYYSLALVNEEMGSFEEALEAIRQALALEPLNPRYLDTALRISIIIKNKEFALESYEALKKSNPDNQKLAEFREQIELL